MAAGGLFGGGSAMIRVMRAFAVANETIRDGAAITTENVSVKLLKHT